VVVEGRERDILKKKVKRREKKRKEKRCGGRYRGRAVLFAELEVHAGG
jgi:hypothetical protein